MKLVTRRAKFKLDQGQEAVGGEGVRESWGAPPPPPPALFVCSVLSDVQTKRCLSKSGQEMG